MASNAILAIINIHSRERASPGKAGGSVQQIRTPREPRKFSLGARHQSTRAHTTFRPRGPSNPKAAAAPPHRRDRDTGQSLHASQEHHVVRGQAKVISRQMSSRRHICRASRLSRTCY